jgi:hypothetical protein
MLPLIEIKWFVPVAVVNNDRRAATMMEPAANSALIIGPIGLPSGSDDHYRAVRALA